MPLIRFNGDTPLADIAPHARTEPPPCLTVGLRHSARNLSPTRLRTYSLLFVPKTSNFVSSVKRTRYHWANVQFLCKRAQSNLFLMFCLRSKGLEAATRPINPNTLRPRLTVAGETLCSRLMLNSVTKRGNGLRRSRKQHTFKCCKSSTVKSFFRPLTLLLLSSLDIYS